MIDLLTMSDKARAFHGKPKAEPREVDPYVDFQRMLSEVAVVRRLREMSNAIGVSHSHLSMLGSGGHKQPTYMLGCKIIQWYDANMLGGA